MASIASDFGMNIVFNSPYAGCQFDPHPARCARLPPPNSGEDANRSLLAPLLEFGEGSGVGSEITICVR